MLPVVWIIVDGPKGEDFEIHVMCSMASQERAPLEITIAPSMWPFDRPFRYFDKKAKLIVQRMEGIPSNTDVRGYRLAGILDGQRMECMYLPAPPEGFDHGFIRFVRPGSVSMFDARPTEPWA